MEGHMTLKILTICIVYSVVVDLIATQDQGICTQLSECTCRMPDGNVVDISSLGNSDGTPLFHDIRSTDGYVYSYNPCGGFTEGVCNNAAVCKKDPTSGESLMIGRAVGAEFSYDEETNQIVVVYTAGQLGEFHTIAYLLCEPAPHPGPPQFFPNGTADTNLFVVTLYSVCACPGRCDSKGVLKQSSTFGIGWIVLICIGGIIILYLVIGTLFMKFVKKASGTDLIPNKNFWVNVPKNVKNGSTFLFYKCTGKKENYSDFK